MEPNRQDDIDNMKGFLPALLIQNLDRDLNRCPRFYCCETESMVMKADWVDAPLFEQMPTRSEVANFIFHALIFNKTQEKANQHGRFSMRYPTMMVLAGAFPLRAIAVTKPPTF
jgi:hypothetical protein